jgi:hypothetical protein
MDKHSENRRLKRRQDLLSSRMDEETVMMNPETGKYYSLNPVATRIWELLSSPVNLDTIISVLTREFNVPEETCRTETLTFIQKLKDNSMIEYSDET